MNHTVPQLKGGSESEKESTGEPKELKKNSTVHVEMKKMIPNKAKLARIAARKKREEEEKKKKEEEKKKNASKAAAAQTNATKAALANKNQTSAVEANATKLSF